MDNSIKPYAVGDLIRPADGSEYRGEIIHVDGQTIRHRCLKTGAIYEKDRFGFFCRYSTLEEYEADMVERANEEPDALDLMIAGMSRG